MILNLNNVSPYTWCYYNDRLVWNAFKKRRSYNWKWFWMNQIINSNVLYETYVSPSLPWGSNKYDVSNSGVEVQVTNAAPNLHVIVANTRFNYKTLIRRNYRIGGYCWLSPTFIRSGRLGLVTWLNTSTTPWMVWTDGLTETMGNDEYTIRTFYTDAVVGETRDRLPTMDMFLWFM